jgi:hypothetical protein
MNKIQKEFVMDEFFLYDKYLNMWNQRIDLDDIAIFEDEEGKRFLSVDFKVVEIFNCKEMRDCDKSLSITEEESRLGHDDFLVVRGNDTQIMPLRYAKLIKKSKKKHV